MRAWPHRAAASRGGRTPRWLMMALSAALLTACGSQPPPPAQAVEVFEATTPCDPSAPPLPQIPAGTTCEMAIWHVGLRPDGTFMLSMAYGMSQPNTMNVRDGGVNVEMSGAWETLSEPGPSGLAIIELTDPTTSPVRFAKISDHLLHLLDGQGRLKIGNAAWSYTLNRAGITSPQAPAAVNPISPSGQDISGTFQGRTPCQQAIATFLGRPEQDDCRRIKLRVELRATPGSTSNGDYLTNAVYVASGARGQQAGTWRQRQDAPGIIELEPASGGFPLRLILVDYNHLLILDNNNRALVGDAHHSYTLSRDSSGVR